MNVFIIGATGGVGRRLRKRLVNAAHQVTGLHRRDSQKEALEADGVKPVNIDLMNTSSERLAAAMPWCSPQAQQALV